MMTTFEALVGEVQAISAAVSLAERRGQPQVAKLLEEGQALRLARILRDYPRQVTLRGDTVTSTTGEVLGSLSAVQVSALLPTQLHVE